MAEQTVRATFKTKANLVEHLLRLTIRGSDGDLELQQREAFQHMLASDDAATLLARLTGLAATFKEFELIGDYRTFDDPDRQV